MKKIIYVFIAAIGITAVIFSCKKDQTESNQPEQEIFLTEDQKMTQHIVEFKEKCNYYLENPGLKSGETMTVEEAVTDLEAAMNYTYSFNDPTADLHIERATIDLQPSPDNKFPMDEVATLLNDVTREVQQQYFDAPYADADKILILVDLDLKSNSNGDPQLGIVSVIGNRNLPGHNYTSWKFGELRGTCAGGYQGISDAAKRLQIRVHHLVWENPQPNQVFYFTNVEAVEYYNPKDFPNVGPIDNYMDYLIYYAHANVSPLVDSVECVSAAAEMPFYRDNYVDFAEDVELTFNKTYKQCYFTGQDANPVWRHLLNYYIGDRWIGEELPIGIGSINLTD